MAGIVAEGAESVQTVLGVVAKATAKRTAVLNTTVLRVPRSPLMTVGAFIFQEIDMKMPRDVGVKTTSL